MEMKRKDVIETCRGVGRSCVLLDGSAVAEADDGARCEVDLRSMAAGVSAGLAYAEALLSGAIEIDDVDYETQARNVVEAAAAAELKFRMGRL